MIKRIYKLPSFGQRLRFALQEKNVTQLELSEGTGLSVKTINTWCQDKLKTDPRKNNVNAVAKFLNIDIDFLKGTTLELGVYKELQMPKGEQKKILDSKIKSSIESNREFFLRNTLENCLGYTISLEECGERIEDENYLIADNEVFVMDCSHGSDCEIIISDEKGTQINTFTRETFMNKTKEILNFIEFVIKKTPEN